MKILVDTSVWIDFFNKSGSSDAEILSRLIDSGAGICLCPIIYQEILQGIKDDNIFNDVKSILSSYPMLNTDILKITDLSINLYRTLRKQGITIRKSVDVLIAAYAVSENAYLLHKDRDFAQISASSGLKIYKYDKEIELKN
ncbi:MAG: PIN domain nuclease [Elusimicrobiota bacterium]|jgi:predicted nucleic acid-binding protein|nr:PIN domain nuclease [Elusimicrobiota bacterium]